MTAKQKLCVGNTCVTEQQLQAVLELLNGQGSVAGTSTPPPQNPHHLPLQTNRQPRHKPYTLSMFKGFLEWIQLKEKLHGNAAKSPLVRERDIWWISFGENIGSEMNGKSKLFSRPALILKKLSHGFFMVAPTTTQPHEGTWYVKITYADRDMWVCLHQIRTIDYRRLSTQIGQLDVGDFTKVKEAFWRLYQ